jgi:hypothetical protein
MIRKVTLVGGLFALVAAIPFACADGGTGDGDDGDGDGSGEIENVLSEGVCADTCPKACDEDDECNTAEGEICCSFGGDGRACMPAQMCPRFCDDDSTCDSAKGEACLRPSLATPQSACMDPVASIKLCQDDGSCALGEECCTIYKEPVCVPTGLCPNPCSQAAECDTAAKQVCCTTLSLIDETLGVPGLCVDPGHVPCPKACAQSADCNTGDGELCCDGICSTSCPKKCEESNECNGQVCCKTAAIFSPWLGAAKPGYYAGNNTTSTSSSSTGNPGDCDYQFNGVCDEPNGTGLCPFGTDFADCQSQGECPYENDGECDVPGLCPPGTDVADCNSSGGCIGCAEWINGGVDPLCPASNALAAAVDDCICVTCASACSGICNGGDVVDPACQTCFDNTCQDELQDCLAD